MAEAPIPETHYYTADEIKAIRKKRGQNQADFWQVFGVTQSAGSRYESGRDMPGPVQILLNIAFDKEASEVVKLLQRVGMDR